MKPKHRKPSLTEPMTAGYLSQWMKDRSLTAKQLGELLPANSRTVEGWRNGRFKIPPFLWRALLHLERELSEKEK